LASMPTAVAARPGRAATARPGAGEWFGPPAIVMSLLPGRLTLTPDDEERWAGELASALAAVSHYSLLSGG
jgi:hypothetical protein